MLSEVIASAVVECARLGVTAYAIKRGSEVLMHWLTQVSTQTNEAKVEAQGPEMMWTEERRI